MLRFLQLPENFVVLQESKKRLSTGIEKEIDRIWAVAKEASGARLFNGLLFSVEQLTSDAVRGCLIEYRIYHAQLRRPELFSELGVQPLAVTGLLRNREGLFFGLRGSGLAQQVDRWELIPAGGIDAATLTSDGRVQPHQQLLTELEEEVGLNSAEVEAPRLVCFSEDLDTHIFELVWDVETDLDTKSVMSAQSAIRHPEHAEIRCVPWRDLNDFVTGSECPMVSANRDLLNHIFTVPRAESLGYSVLATSWRWPNRNSLMQNDQSKPANADLSVRSKGTGQRLYQYAKTRIPGGTQLLSKRPEMALPELWPAYYKKAKGAEVWDLDDNRYIDFTHNGVGSCLLGYADPDVNAAVKAAIDAGSMSTLNAPEEVELADLLCELHPWAEKVRYARTGGEAMAIAVRLARAATGRDKVAFCGYHGWNDWYLAANLGESSALDGHLLPGLSPRGVPRGLQGTALAFRYNDLAGLEQILAEHKHEIAAVVMEPMRSDPPQPGFLDGVRAAASEHGAVLIMDEITTGFRLTIGGAHLTLGLVPDLAVFAKAISNGYPMAAIIGTAKHMNAAQETFVSSTYWTERIGPVAALATINKHRSLNLPKLLAECGDNVRKIWSRAAAEAGIGIKISGAVPLPAFAFVHPEAQVLKTLFTERMLEQAYLAGTSVYVTYAHTAELLDNYAGAFGRVFLEIGDLLRKNPANLTQYLKGPVAHSGFSRLA